MTVVLHIFPSLLDSSKSTRGCLPHPLPGWQVNKTRGAYTRSLARRMFVTTFLPNIYQKVAAPRKWTWRPACNTNSQSFPPRAAGSRVTVSMSGCCKASSPIFGLCFIGHIWWHAPLSALVFSCHFICNALCTSISGTRQGENLMNQKSTKIRQNEMIRITAFYWVTSTCQVQSQTFNTCWCCHCLTAWSSQIL